MKTILTVLLLLLALPAHADYEAGTTTASGKALSFCKHTLTTEKMLGVTVTYLLTEGRTKTHSATFKETWKLPPQTYTVAFTKLAADDKITGIRIACTFQIPNPNIAPTETRETQPWVESQWIAVKMGDVLKMGVSVQEPAPGLRTVTIGGFR